MQTALLIRTNVRVTIDDTKIERPVWIIVIPKKRLAIWRLGTLIQARLFTKCAFDNRLIIRKFKVQKEFVELVFGLAYVEAALHKEFDEMLLPVAFPDPPKKK